MSVLSYINEYRISHLNMNKEVPKRIWLTSEQIKDLNQEIYKIRLEVHLGGRMPPPPDIRDGKFIYGMEIKEVNDVV